MPAVALPMNSDAWVRPGRGSWSRCGMIRASASARLDVRPAVRSSTSPKHPKASCGSDDRVVDDDLHRRTVKRYSTFLRWETLPTFSPFGL